MTDPYPEARRRARLDTTDHARLLEENRAAYLADRAERLRNEIRTLQDAERMVSSDEIRREIHDKRAELERIGSVLEDERPIR